MYKMYKNRCEGITKLDKRCKNSKQMDLCFCCIHKPKETCSICLENINNKVQLDCGHTFCKKCIFTWLSTCKTTSFYCPMCKTDVSDKIKSDAWDYGIENNLLYEVRVIKYNVNNISEDEYNIIRPVLLIFENILLGKEIIDTIIINLSAEKFYIFSKIIEKYSIYYTLENKLYDGTVPDQDYFYILNETYI